MTVAAGGFGVAVDFDTDPVVVAIRGEVDLLTGPDLAAVLNAVIAQSHSLVVLDLAELEFIDASGIRVILHAAALLAPTGRVLVLRSPTPVIRKILDITGLASFVRVETTAPRVETLGSEQQPGDGSVTVAGESAEPARDLNRSIAIRATDDVLDATLRLVVELARATVGGADGVSVSLERGGELVTVAASDDTIAQMDRDQYATGQGPCLAAASAGHWFHVESLSHETRWPEFIPRARGGGIGSILSTPLMTSARSVGALNIYSKGERVFGVEEQSLAAMFATQASGILIDAGFDRPTEDATRLRSALATRAVIAQAQGIVMARSGVSAEEAYAVLRRSARDEASSVRRAAMDIVASTRRASPPGK